MFKYINLFFNISYFSPNNFFFLNIYSFNKIFYYYSKLLKSIVFLVFLKKLKNVSINNFFFNFNYIFLYKYLLVVNIALTFFFIFL